MRLIKISKISLVITIILILFLVFLIFVAVKVTDSYMFCLLRNPVFLHAILHTPVLLRCLLFIYAINLEGLQVVIGAAGIAGGVLSTMTTVKLRRVNGVILDEVLNCYFPLYWVMFILNCIFVAWGQYWCVAGRAISGFICFIGAVLCLIYISAVGAVVAVSEKTAHKLTSRYINKLASKLSLIHSGQDNPNSVKGEELRSKTIGSIGEYIASQLEKATAPFYISQGVEQQIRALLKICGDSNSSNNYSIIEDFIYFVPEDKNWQLPGMLEDIAYYELPLAKEGRKRLSEEVGHASEMWESILSPLHKARKAERTACRVLYTHIKQDKGDSHGHISAICCGLVVYLYSYFRSKGKYSEYEILPRCAEFVYQMDRTIDSETQDAPAEQQYADELLRICGEMLVLLITMAYTEQYYSKTVNNESVNPIVECLRRLHYRGGGDSIIVNLLEEHTTRYLYYATLILNRLPSVAARVQTIQQKRKLKDYVVAMISLQFRRKGL